MNKREYFKIVHGTIINTATEEEITRLWKLQNEQTDILNELFIRKN